MKKKYFYTLAFIFFIGKFLYSQTTTFIFQMSSNDDFYINDVLESNNEIYFVSTVAKPNSYFSKGIIIKISQNGEIIDSITVKNQNQRIYLKQIIIDTANTFIIQGIKSDTITPFQNNSLKFIKIDTALIYLSNKDYSFPSDYQIFNSFLDKGKNNELLIVGTVLNPIVGYLFLYKLNRNFDSLQAKFYVNESPMFGTAVKELNNGNFWVLRGIQSYYALIDSNFNLVSPEEGVIPEYINGNNAVKWDSDTSFYLAGDYIPETSRVSDHDIGFIRQYHPFDSTGSLFNSWGARDTVDFPALYTSIDYHNKDSIFIGGTKNMGYGGTFFSIPSWYVLMQTDSMLNIRWEHFYGGDAHYLMTDLTSTSDGGCIMAGTRFDYIAHPNLHKRDIYIIKVNNEGLITSTDGKPSPIVHSAIVFPNPGNEVMQIRVAVQYPLSLLRLFDMNGRLVVKKKIQGTSATINTAFLPKGTYIYTITGENGLHENGKWVKK